MGLVGILSGVKKFIPSFLHIGAVLMIMGGLFACCYNCDYYGLVGNKRRTWKSLEGSTASAALASGIIGVFAAVAAVAAVVLSFTGLSGMVVNIVYAVTCVLYIAEVIPEGIIVSAKWTHLDALESWDSQFADWFANAEEAQNDAELWPENVDDTIKGLFQNAMGHLGVTFMDGWSSAELPWRMRKGTQKGQQISMEAAQLKAGCIINWRTSKVQDAFDTSDHGMKIKDCGKIELKVKQCVPTWSEDALNSAAKDLCEAKKLEEDEAEAKKKKYTELYEAYEKEEKEKKAKADELYAKEDKAEYYTYMASFSSLKQIAENADEEKEKKEDRLDEVSAGLKVANQAMIAIQTVGFIFTLVGVVLSFAMSALPGGDDAAKADA